MVEVHLLEIMTNCTVKIVLLLETEMRILDKARANNSCLSSINIYTSYDDIEDNLDIINSNKFNKKNNDSIKLLVKKKPCGRLLKIMGDISLLVSSPVDALEYYLGIYLFMYLPIYLSF